VRVLSPCFFSCVSVCFVGVFLSLSARVLFCECVFVCLSVFTHMCVLVCYMFASVLVCVLV